MPLTYTVQCDWDRDETFGHPDADITGMVEQLRFSGGMTSAYQEVAPPATCIITLVDPAGEWLPEKGGTYAALIAPGVLVRVRVSDGVTTETLFIGKLDAAEMSIDRSSSGTNAYRVQLTVRDPMLELLDAEYFPALLLDVRTDAALRALFDAVVITYPYPAFVLDASALDNRTLYTSAPTAFETGLTTLAFAGDNDDQGRGVSAQGAVRSLVAAEAGGRFFWDARGGAFVFHNRHHDALEMLADTFTADDLTGADPRYLEDMANAITITYSPRQIGAPNTVIYTMPNVPTRLKAGDERVFTARYTTREGAKVGALTVIPPVAGTDYAAIYEDESGVSNAPLELRKAGITPTGDDATGALTVIADAGGGSAKVTIRNSSERDVLITLFQVRGTPLESFERASATAADAMSIAAYGRREKTTQIDLLDDDELAQSIARQTLSRCAQPIFRLESAMLIANALADPMAALALGMGARVRIADGGSGHDAAYILVGERHEINARDRQHKLTWILQPAARANLFIVDTSTLGGADVVAL